ncbi:MAG: hypothetical protein WDA07_10305 [Leucobacter sp.]
MSEQNTNEPIRTDAAASPLTLLGDESAAGVCGPDSCELPASSAPAEEVAPAAEFGAAASSHEPAAGFGGAASFADAESREILNLLGGGGTNDGACCGGSCCA